eukprot:TRINITY_DN5123_c0_g1_i1.p1 TRINITY_DN5123_c0_g1~~TRINITY_DN5123_c0_g1_i1.p1  ORF type:complete len:270 (-),score=14.85 TRINITY_DN5123_c0_g1_i1:121-930(-)
MFWDEGRLDFVSVNCLANVYAEPVVTYQYDLSLPEFANGSTDPDGHYRGRCSEPNCSCGYYRYDTGTGCTNIRCSMCDHTPLQHVRGRPPVPVLKSMMEKIKNGDVSVDPTFLNRPIGQSFSITKKFVQPKNVTSIGRGANPYTSYESSVCMTCLFALPFPFLCLGALEFDTFKRTTMTFDEQNQQVIVTHCSNICPYGMGFGHSTHQCHYRDLDMGYEENTMLGKTSVVLKFPNYATVPIKAKASFIAGWAKFLEDRRIRPMCVNEHH